MENPPNWSLTHTCIGVSGAAVSRRCRWYSRVDGVVGDSGVVQLYIHYYLFCWSHLSKSWVVEPGLRTGPRLVITSVRRQGMAPLTPVGWTARRSPVAAATTHQASAPPQSILPLRCHYGSGRPSSLPEDSSMSQPEPAIG